MMKKTIFVLLLMVVIFSTSAFADYCGGTIQCHCGDFLVESQTMWYDLINCSNYGLLIAVGDTILDCNNHLIDGDGSGTWDAGIFLYNSEVTVTNCNIQEFHDGVYTDKSSSNNILTQNLIRSNSLYGIELHKSYGNLVYSNTLIDNQWYGIRLDESFNNNIWNNTFLNNIQANAYEDENSNNNNWNLSNIGNYWDDFSSNPEHPYQYEIPGPGNGIDYHPVGELPWVLINLTPIGNTTFPPTGGRLNYNILVGNNEDTTVRLDAWTDITTPNGSIYLIHRPLLNFEMPPGFSTIRNRTINIPTRAPAGEYSFNSYLGIYSVTTLVIYAEDYFNFTKEEV